MVTGTRFKAALLLLLSVIIGLTLAVTTASASSYENGALTPPPPEADKVARFVQTPNGSQTGKQGTNTPYLAAGNLYLYDYTNLLGNNHNSSVNISGSTTATASVNTIGVQLTLQKWDGSNWTDFEINPTSSLSSTSYISTSKDTSVIKGYYYRIVSYHYVNQLGTYESGSLYGAYSLIN